MCAVLHTLVLLWPSEIVWCWIGTRHSRTKLSRTRSEFTVGATKQMQRIWSNRALDLSLEFLMGRALDNAMLNLEKKDIAEGMCHRNPIFVTF